MSDQKKKNQNQNQNRSKRNRRQRRRGKQMNGDTKSLSAPVAKTKQQRTPRPKINNLPNGDCYIVHREYIEDVTAAGGTPSNFKVTSLPINPGQKLTFQWLSRIAANYESYQFDKLNFVYETEASTNLGGSLVLAVDYDATDDAPLSKQAAMAYRRSVRTAPWTGVTHVSIAEDLHKNKTNFVRPGAQPVGTDLKTYDIGNLYVISQGVSTAAATLGEMYVEYAVKLMTPVFDPLTPITFGGNIAGDVGDGLSAANPFGVAPDIIGDGINMDAASNLSFANLGTYLITFKLVGTTITADSLVAAGTSTVTLKSSQVLASGLGLTSVYAVEVTDLLPLAYTATAATLSACNSWIALAPAGTL